MGQLFSLWIRLMLRRLVSLIISLNAVLKYKLLVLKVKHIVLILFDYVLFVIIIPLCLCFNDYFTLLFVLGKGLFLVVSLVCI